MIFHENRLPADDSHEISCLNWLFLKNGQNLILPSAANCRWRFKLSALSLQVLHVSLAPYMNSSKVTHYA